MTAPRRTPSAEAPGENPLLGMKPVLRFVPHDRLRAVDDTGGHLFTAFDRQTMHKDRVGLGVRHQVFVDAVGREQVVAGCGRARSPPEPTHACATTSNFPGWLVRIMIAST